MLQARPGSAGDISDRHIPAAEYLAHVRSRLLGAAIRSEPVIDDDHAFVRDDIASHSAPDPYRVQALTIGQAIDQRLARLVADQHIEDPARLVDRVPAPPC